MVFKKSLKSSKKMSRTYKRKTLRKTYKKKFNLKKYVKSIASSVVHKNTENKEAYTTQVPVDFNSAISASGDVLRIIPNVAQGTDGHNRIGDKITPLSLTSKLILQMLPQGSAQGSGVSKLAVRLMLITPKSYPNWATASANTATWMPQLLKKGGTTVGFTGDISDLFAPYNSQAITLHWQKVYFFNQSYSTIPSNNTTPLAFDQAHLTKFITIPLKFRKKMWQYSADVDSGLTPTNAGYFLVLGYAFTDGTSPDIVATRVRLQYDSVLRFEDN